MLDNIKYFRIFSFYRNNLKTKEIKKRRLNCQNISNCFRTRVLWNFRKLKMISRFAGVIWRRLRVIVTCHTCYHKIAICCIYAEYLNDWLNVGILQVYQVWSFVAPRWSIRALLMLMTLLINTAHKSLELTMIINYCLSVNYATPPLLDGSARASDN